MALKHVASKANSIIASIIKRIILFIVSIFFDRYDNLREVWVMALFVVAVVAIVGGLTYGVYVLDRNADMRQCDTYSVLNSDYEIQYVERQGCLIKIDGLWVNKDGIYSLLDKE